MYQKKKSKGIQKDEGCLKSFIPHETLDGQSNLIFIYAFFFSGFIFIENWTKGFKRKGF